MDPGSLPARRATLEDLPALQALWQRAGLPWEQLEKFFAEFQVVPGADGSILAAMGLLVEGAEGLLHTEAIASDELADQCRATLWKRIQIVARNNGAVRIWTQEDSPFWKQQGFANASVAQTAELKATFADPAAAWRVFQLMDPDKASRKVAETLALWEASRHSESDELRRRIQSFRTFAFILAAVVIGGMVLIALFVFVRNPDLIQKLMHHR